MAQEKDSRLDGRPQGDTIAGTGPGISDDALAPGEELPTPPSKEEIAAIERKLDFPVPDYGEPT